MIGRSVRFALLAHLQLCTIRPAIVDLYERDSQIEVAQWLHNQYRRYAIHVYDLGQPDLQYHISMLDLTVASGDEPLLFTQRAPEEASKMLPQPSRNCRLIVFPQTRYSFLEDEVHRSTPLQIQA